MGRISIRGLSKQYEERRRGPRALNHRWRASHGEHTAVLDGIDLELEEGELVCILGPSGCGKSTLLRIVAGFEKPSGGSIAIDGRAVAGPSPHHIFVFQHSGLFPWMTVWENAALGVRQLKDRHAAARKVRETLEIVDLAGFEQHYPHELSGGMQRRAELARALVVNPDILFMDEPFAGLDYLTRLKLREEIIDMHSFLQKTVLFITHDIDEALVMGDRIVLLSDRPARVRLDEVIGTPHPRDFSRDAALADLRRHLYRMLDVHFAL